MRVALVARIARCWALACLLVCAGGAGAVAQTPAREAVERADALFDEGDLQAALAAYDELLEAGALDRELHAHVVARQMLAHSARRDEASTRAAARRFWTLGGSSIPSEISTLARAWIEAERGGTATLSLTSSEVVPSADGFLLILRVHGVRPDQHVRLTVADHPPIAGVLPGALTAEGDVSVEVALPGSLAGSVAARLVIVDGAENAWLDLPLRLEVPALVPPVEDAPRTVATEPDSAVAAAEVDPVSPAAGAPNDIPTWPEPLVVSGSIVLGTGLASFAAFFGATVAGWESLSRCGTADCEPHLDWTPQLADASMGLAIVGAALLVAGLIGGAEASAPSASARSSGVLRW